MSTPTTMNITDMPEVEWESVPVETAAPAPTKKPRNVAAPKKDAPVAAPAPAVAVGPTHSTGASSILDKMRQIFSSEVNILRVPIYTSESGADPVFTYGLRKITHEDWKVIAYAYLKVMPADVQVDKAVWDLATMCASICTLDEGPLLPGQEATPVWKALGIEPENTAYVRNKYIPDISVRKLVVDILFPMMYSDLSVIGDVLLAQYVAVFDAQYVGATPQPLTEEPGASENPTIPER